MKSSFTYFGQRSPIFLRAPELYASTQPKGGGATQLPLTVESLNGMKLASYPHPCSARREYDITGGIDVVMVIRFVQSYSDRHQALLNLRGSDGI